MTQLLHVLALLTAHRESKSSGQHESHSLFFIQSKNGLGKVNACSPVTQPLSSKFPFVPNVYGCKSGFFGVVHIVCTSTLQPESSPPESSMEYLESHGEPFLSQ